MEQQQSSTKSLAFAVLAGATFVYAAIFLFLMNETAGCIAVIRPQWGYLEVLDVFIQRQLSCRTINELGDALAGAFAPVAFLWLAGAVFIQSKELQAQKEELIETRDVMRSQLEVAKLQVEETRASTALFRQQTDILVQQHLLRAQEVTDKTLVGVTAALRNNLSREGTRRATIRVHSSRTEFSREDESSPNMPSWFQLKNNQRYHASEFTIGILPDGPKFEKSDLREICQEIKRSVRDSSQSLSKILSEKSQTFHEFPNLAQAIGLWAEIARTFDLITNLSEKMSQAQRIELTSIDVFEIFPAITDFIEFARVVEAASIMQIAEATIKWPEP